MTRFLKPLLLSAFAAGALAGGAPAFAQIYKCVGKDGKTVYSQSTCPSGAKSAPIQERVPGTAPPPPPAPAADASGKAPAPAAKPAGPKTLAEQNADFNKRRADQEEAAKKDAKAKEDADTKERNCLNARTGLASLQMGGRQSRVNAQGERYFLDDSQIAEETARAKQAVTSWCGG